MRLQSASAACGLFAPLLLLCCARNVSADIHLSASECNAAKGGCASALSSAITQCGCATETAGGGRNLQGEKTQEWKRRDEAIVSFSLSLSFPVNV